MKKFDLKKTVAKAKSLDYKKLARDFVYGKPAGVQAPGVARHQGHLLLLQQGVAV